MKINDPIDHSIRESPGPSAHKTSRRGFLATGLGGWLGATTLSSGRKPLRAEESPSDPAPKKTRIAVTVNGEKIRTVPAQFVVVPFGRGAPMGRTRDGVLYAGFSTEGPGLESILLASSDEGRTWRQKRLDWWQFFDHNLARDSSRWLFFDNRWALRSDSFGILRDGTLIWAFLQIADGCGAGGLEAECYVIRSQDGGRSWQGPYRVDKAPFPSIGNSSNRMTELPDGTVLWPQRLGATSTRAERDQASGCKVFAALDGDSLYRQLRFSVHRRRPKLGRANPIAGLVFRDDSLAAALRAVDGRDPLPAFLLVRRDVGGATSGASFPA